MQLQENKIVVIPAGGGRKSNIELCRIVSIVMVMLLHSDFSVFGWPGNNSVVGIPLIALESFCIIGVNVFVLITGYFSTFPKIKSITNIFYICLFYGLLSIGYNLIVHGQIHLSQLFIVSGVNWFVPCYLGLLLFTPILNISFDNMSQKTYLTTILLIAFYNAYMGFFPAIPHMPVGVNRGYSVLHFIEIYLIGRYIRVYGIPKFMKKYDIWLYVLCSITIVLLTLACVRLGFGDRAKTLYDYSNPICIVSAICFFSFFLKIDINTNKVVNYLAKSVLAVLLFHTSSQVSAITSSNYRFLYDNYSGVSLILLWTLSIITIFFVAVLIDQVRIISYRFISKRVERVLPKSLMY